jgi:hypothetical protein
MLWFTAVIPNGRMILPEPCGSQYFNFHAQAAHWPILRPTAEQMPGRKMINDLDAHLNRFAADCGHFPLKD